MAHRFDDPCLLTALDSPKGLELELAMGLFLLPHFDPLTFRPLVTTHIESVYLMDSKGNEPWIAMSLEATEKLISDLQEACVRVRQIRGI